MTAPHPDPEASEDSVHPTAERHLHLSPMGYRAGLVAYQHNNRSLLLLVVPKLWKHHLCHVSAPARIAIQGDTLQIVAYETERLPLRFTGPDAEQWAQLLDACITELEKPSGGTSDDPTSSDPTTGETAEDELEILSSLFHDPKLSRQLRGLVSHAHGRKPSKSSWHDVPRSTEDTRLTTWLDHLLRLVLFSRRFREHRKDYSPSGSGTGYLVDSGADQSDPLRLLTTHAFIEEVKLRRREVRQGYRVETARLGVIRGRITARGMARHALAGEPRIECTYDEFTSQVPLFQVIVSALDHVAGGGPFPAAYRELPLVQEIRQSAQRLRRELAHIPSLPPAKAAFMAGRVRLKRLQRPWKPALHMARLLLQRLPLDFTAETEGQGALVWNVDTSKVWEGTLQQLLERGRGWEVKPQATAPPPWKGLNAKKPDLLATHGRVFYILDAKYKDRTDGAHTPSASEQYQVFAYSHLAQGREATHHTRGGLPYATRNTTLTSSHGSTPWKRNPGPSATVDLVALAVPFPMPEKLRSDSDWTSWLDVIGPSLRKELEGGIVFATATHTAS
ncbi:MAG TPA: hypothetical protein DFR83_10900 [Deltaproteobacteria bacterium]|nr:hypothetical protein [Deltaproteobacteria bacterium]